MVVRPRSRRASTLVLVILASVTLLIVAGDAKTGPFGAIAGSIRSIGDAVDSVLGGSWPFSRNSRAPRSEIDRLTAERDEARADAARLGDLERRVGELSTLLQWQPPQAIEKLGARVVYIGPSNFDATVTIDRGSDEGVRIGNPVVSPNGLVGRVVNTAAHRATVLLICDTTSSVGIRAPSGDIAVAGGGGLTNTHGCQPLKLDYVDANATLSIGDALTTSGLERSVYPPGIPLGAVSSVGTTDKALRKNVTVTPFIVPSRLDNVVVLKWTPA